MHASSTISPTERLSSSQQEALIQLLADEDPAVFRRIHETILSQGETARVWLQRYRLSEDPRTRRRVRGLIDKLNADHADNVFLSFCLTHGSRLDIEEGLFLLAATSYPDINLEGYRALLDGYAEEVRNRVAQTRSPEHILGTLNRLLFIQLGYRGTSPDDGDPALAYLNKAMDRRRGDPLLMSALYLSVCRRLSLPVAGVGLPGNFLCRYQDPSTEIYVDAYNGGKFLTRTDCVHHLVKLNCNLKDDYLGPIDSSRMLLRSVVTLQKLYHARGDMDASLRMRGYVTALTKRMPRKRAADKR